WGIAPAQQTPRHHTDLIAEGQETQEQVVVFRPATITIPQRLQDLAAQHQSRMSKRTFDKRVLLHPTWCVDAVEPVLVGPPALWQAMTRKEAHMTAYCGQVRALLKRLYLQGQPLAMHQVVSIHTGHKVPAAVCEPGVQGSNESLMRRRDNGKTGVLRRK